MAFGIARALVKKGIAALALSILASGAHAALAEKMALVIGNSHYRNGDRLQTPGGDARMIGSTLEGLGFQVRVLTDRSRAQLLQDIDGFSQDARGSRVALVYYAGHGFEVDHQNYLIPVDLPHRIADLTKAEVPAVGVPLRYLMQSLARAHPQALVVVLDACRDAPERGVTKAPGLSAEDAPRGTLIAYSTGPGQNALDTMRTLNQPIDHSPFSYYLNENMQDRDANLNDVLQKTQVDVAAVTGEGQRPWISSGLIGTLNLAGIPALAPTQHDVLPAASLGKPPHFAPMRGATPTLGSFSATAPNQSAVASMKLWDDEEVEVTRQAKTLDGESLASEGRRAAAGDAQAATVLCMAYSDGDFVAVNDHRAMHYCQQAANNGYPIAETLLGETYFTGTRTIPKNRPMAERWLRSAASAGHRRAQLDMLQLQSEHTDPNDPASERALALSLMQTFKAAVAR